MEAARFTKPLHEREATSSASTATPNTGVNWDTVLAKVDLQAYCTLAHWGKAAVPSAQALESLHCMRGAAQQAPDGVLRECSRLRLVALLTKVLNFLQRNPRPELISAVDGWVEGLKDLRSRQAVEESWENSLRVVFNAIPSTRRVAVDVQSGSSPVPDALISEVAEAGQFINECMPRPCLLQRAGVVAPTGLQNRNLDQVGGDGKPVHDYGPMRRKRRHTSGLAIVPAMLADSVTSSMAEADTACGQTVPSVVSAALRESSTFYGDVPRMRAYTPWSDDEELRLVEGQRRYGNQWELIRKRYNLRHRLGTQLREKWRNLNRSGRVREVAPLGSPGVALETHEECSAHSPL